jgi:hypothetical protein
MPSDSLKQSLYDIRDNILLAQRFVEDLTFETFKQSPLHFYATTRALEYNVGFLLHPFPSLAYDAKGTSLRHRSWARFPQKILSRLRQLGS